MSRVAVLCALCASLLLAGCGSAARTTTGSSHTPTRSAPSPSSTPASGAAADASASAPAGPWTGSTAATQWVAVLTGFTDAMNPSVNAVNAFGRGDLPSDADFPSAWAPLAAGCSTSATASATAVRTLQAQHAQGHWSAASWQAIQPSIREMQWWGREERACAAVKTKADLLGWTVGVDVQRANRLDVVFQRTRDVIAP